MDRARPRQDEMTVNYYRLDLAATMTGLSVQRVRTYVRHGLVQPARVENRQLLFSTNELAELRRIRRLSDDLGLNLAGIQVALQLLNEISRLQSMLDERTPQR
jgi:MerR family transcriptional regulator/heat shock protein HspR